MTTRDQITAAFCELAEAHPALVDRLYRVLVAAEAPPAEMSVTRAEWEALGAALRKHGVRMSLRDLGVQRIVLTDTAPMSDEEIVAGLGGRGLAEESIDHDTPTPGPSPDLTSRSR